MSLMLANIPESIIKDVPSYYIQVSEVDRRLVGTDLSGKLLLNIGCGQYLIDDYYFAKSSSIVTSIDYSQTSVKVAKEKLYSAFSKGELSKSKFKWTVQEGDGCRLHYPDNHFDIVVSFSAIEHMPKESDRIKALKEMYRVLKPGGRFVIVFPNAWNLPTGYLSRKTFQKIKEYEYRYSPLELKKILSQLGIKDLRFDSESLNKVDDELISFKFSSTPLRRFPSFVWWPISVFLFIFNWFPLFKTFGMRMGYSGTKRL